jgi:hypothetical protein
VSLVLVGPGWRWVAAAGARLVEEAEADEDEHRWHDPLAPAPVPIDVLAERLNITRGALYKTLHDARQKLRAALAARGLGINGDERGEER